VGRFTLLSGTASSDRATSGAIHAKLPRSKPAPAHH
jgi:hypothetical protein